MENINKKILVAYFSHKGMNYLSGDIKELKKGNTEVIAEMIAAEAEADIFEIEATYEYPFEYAQCVEVSKD